MIRTYEEGSKLNDYCGGDALYAENIQGAGDFGYYEQEGNHIRTSVSQTDFAQQVEVRDSVIAINFTGKNDAGKYIADY